MFKKFNSQEINGNSQVKTSVARAIKAKILQSMGGRMSQEMLDDLIPKKAAVYIIKCLDNTMQLIQVDNKILFFSFFDGPFMPSLLLLHRMPDLLPRVKVDKGAIKFVLKGADVMCPGLTSAGARLPHTPNPDTNAEVDEEDMYYTEDEEVGKDRAVSIYAQGKEHALAIGVTSMSIKDIKTINKGIGLLNMHVIGDGLWDMLIQQQNQ